MKNFVFEKITSEIQENFFPQLDYKRNPFNFVTQTTKELPLVSFVMTNESVSFVITREHTNKQTTTRFVREIPLVLFAMTNKQISFSITNKRNANIRDTKLFL